MLLMRTWHLCRLGNDGWVGYPITEQRAIRYLMAQGWPEEKAKEALQNQNTTCVEVDPKDCVLHRR